MQNTAPGLSAEFPSPRKLVVLLFLELKSYMPHYTYMLYFLLCIYVTHHLSLFVFVDRKLRANTTMLSKNFFKLQDNFFNAKSYRSPKYKTDIWGALLSGEWAKQPRNLVPPHLPPSLVTSELPLRTLSGREGFSNKTQEACTTKEKIDTFDCIKSVSVFFLKRHPKWSSISEQSAGRRCLHFL